MPHCRGDFLPLRLMYITNRAEIARIAEKNGVDRIFVDMEYIGKAERQRGMDSVKSKHTIEDVKTVRGAVSRAQVLVRVNPVHESQADGYPCSEVEIDSAIAAGADVIMLPYYKSMEEVERFLSAVNGRVKTVLLLETAEATQLVDEVARLDGVDEIHIGLNDLSIAYHKTFLFELLSDGTVERLCRHISQTQKPYGFGGLASLGRGLVPAEMILKEHYRLGSTGAILSRSFCNLHDFHDLKAIDEVFYRGIREIRKLEQECEVHRRFFSDNKENLRSAIQQVLQEK